MLGAMCVTMNKIQRAVLLVTGLLIAAIQLIWIAEKGLDESRGWAISFLISAFLLFVGAGTWKGFGRPTFISRPENVLPPPIRAEDTKPASPSTKNAQEQPDKHRFGIHISELDIAIEAHKSAAGKYRLCHSLKGNGRSLTWNCCASVYASMRFAARKTNLKVHNSVWNTIIHATVVRMTSDNDDDLGIGDPGYDALEREAYIDVERLNTAVDAALKAEHVEPVATVLARMFGTPDGEPRKWLVAHFAANADWANQKILPELLETFG